MWIRIAAVACTFLLAGCACTAVGCRNVIRVAIPTDLLSDVAYRAHACFDGDCEEVVLEATATRFGHAGHLVLNADEDVIDYELGEGQFDGAHTYEFRLVSPDGEHLAELDHSGRLDRSAPNGWLCGPTCWGLELTVADASGGWHAAARHGAVQPR